MIQMGGSPDVADDAPPWTGDDDADERPVTAVLLAMLGIIGMLTAGGIGFLIARGGEDAAPVAEAVPATAEVAAETDGAVDDGVVDEGVVDGAESVQAAAGQRDEPPADAAPTASADESGDTSGDASNEVSGAAESSGEASDEVSGAADPSGGDVVASAPANGAFLTMTLENYQYAVSGRVPDETTATAIADAVAATYGPLGVSDVEVDPAVGSPGWLAAAPVLVEGFIALLDGTLTIDGDATVLTGRSPDPESVGLVAQIADPARGFPPLDASGVELVDLRPPTIEGTARDGVLTITGEVPDAVVRDAVVGGAVQIYGPDNVVDRLVVNDGTFARFPVVRFPRLIEIFEKVGDHDIGVRDTQIFADMRDGLLFGSGSAELTEQATAILAHFPDVLDRTTVMTLVEGHTDDIGPEDFNRRLSEDRARAVADWLIANGVGEDRLEVVGKGELEPIADNSTFMGRVHNRRVTLRIGFDTDQ